VADRTPQCAEHGAGVGQAVEDVAASQEVAGVVGEALGVKLADEADARRDVADERRVEPDAARDAGGAQRLEKVRLAAPDLERGLAGQAAAVDEVIYQAVDERAVERLVVKRDVVGGFIADQGGVEQVVLDVTAGRAESEFDPADG
jgi:hypothetical protein